MQIIDFFGFLPPILFFGALIFYSNKFKGKNLTEILEKNSILKELTSALTQQVTPVKKDTPTPIFKADLIPPSINTSEIKSSAGNLLRGIVFVIVLIVAAVYLAQAF
ncbi:MAG: hypothetical protein AAB383_00395 [Patescibacteria group bacterium]